MDIWIPIVFVITGGILMFLGVALGSAINRKEK